MRWPLWAGCLGLVSLAVLGVAVAGQRDGGEFVGGRRATDIGAPYDPGPELRLPGPARSLPLVAWTGREVVVFGGIDPPVGLPRRPRDDGVAYDPRTRRWRAIAPAGFDPPLLDPSGAWVGSALVVAGRPCDDHSRPGDDTEDCRPDGLAVGLYEPARDTWRRVPLPPAVGADVGGWVVGRRAGAAVVAVGDGLWLLDPGSERWSPLPRPPLSGRFCAGDEAVVAIGTPPSARPHAGAAPAEAPPVLLSATLPAGSDHWTPPAPIPAAPVCAGGTAYLPGPAPLRLDPVRNALVPLPPPPVDLGTAPTVTAAGDQVVFWPDDRTAVSYTPATRRWRGAERPGGRRPDLAVWAGGRRYLLVDAEAPGYASRLSLETLAL